MLPTSVIFRVNIPQCDAIYQNNNILSYRHPQIPIHPIKKKNNKINVPVCTLIPIT